MDGKIIIVGAGMAGLLAAGMLRNDCLSVWESAERLPNNHSAVLRFRSSVVGDVLGIPFKQVTMVKCVHPWTNPVADMLAYSRKTNGTATLRSSVSANGEMGTRYIAPNNFIERMFGLVKDKVKFGSQFDFSAYQEVRGAIKENLNECRPVISTIPMPLLMAVLGWRERPAFNSRAGRHITVELARVDAYCSVYDPDPASPVSRVSITGPTMHIECHSNESDDSGFDKDAISRACMLTGLNRDNLITWEGKKQTYAKILPIDEEVRRRFIVWASEQHGVFSLGRFATWRPGLLLDDVVNDVRVIQRLANGGSPYHHRKKA